MSRHLRAVPDLDGEAPATPDAPGWSTWLTSATARPWLEAMRPDPHAEASVRRHPSTFQPATPAPGAWVCPSCGRRVDRAGEAPVVVGRVCAGRAEAWHPPVAMVARR